jgi:DNA-binding transcriptional LysR family regulator
MTQMTEPVETAELLAFARIVEAKSLSRAAAELRVPRATISRRLARLEQRLGVRLLRRTTRSLALTDSGETFYRQARLVLDAVARAEASVHGDADRGMRGDLRVSVPPLSDESFLAVIAAFAKQYPEVRVQIEFSSRLVDLRREGYDVALRATDKIEPGLVARTLRRDELLGVAAPRYLQAHGTPKTAKDLRNHRCIGAFARGELPQSTWRVGNRALHVETAFSSNDIRMLAEAAVQGIGIALLPFVVVEEHLAAGRLVRVLPDLLRSENRLAVVYAEKEFLPAHVRAFVDALVAWKPVLVPPRRKSG